MTGVAVTDWSGASIQINSYDEYGAPAPGNAGRFGYTGQVWLPETGLYHYKNRAYNPELGRFMQTDPIGVNGGMNLYAYVGGDPVNYTDPLGLDEERIRVDGTRIYPPGVALKFAFEWRYLFPIYDFVDLEGNGWNGPGGENAPCEPASDDPNSYNGAVNETARRVRTHRVKGAATGARMVGRDDAYGIVTQRRSLFGGGYESGASRTFRGTYDSATDSVTGSGEIPMIPAINFTGRPVAVVFGPLDLEATFGDYAGRYDAGLRQWLDRVEGSPLSGGFGIENIYIINEDGSCTKHR